MGFLFAKIKKYSSEDVEEVDIIALKDEESSNNVSDTNLQIRGTREALKALAIHFKAEVTSKPPKFFERVVLPFQVITGALKDIFWDLCGTFWTFFGPFLDLFWQFESH